MAIAILKYSKVSDTDYRCDTIHYYPFDSVVGLGKTREQLVAEGVVIIDSPPEDQYIEGKVSELHFNKADLSCWLVFKDAPIPNSEIKKQLDDFEYPKNPDEVFNALDFVNTDIQTIKDKKLEQLYYFCNNEILAGFSSSALGTSNDYGFDYEDQQNLSGALTLMNATPTMTSIQWKVKNVGPVSHTRDQFIQVCSDSFTHKQTLISKYWTLKDQVNNATTVDAIKAIVW